MTLLMPSSGTCGQVREEEIRATPTSWLIGTISCPTTLLGLSIPSGAPTPTHGAHQGVVKVEGADVVGRDIGRSEGTRDLGHDATFI